jgi:hypothetical protein
LKKLFHFFSLAALTQLVLMLSQLILLPLQIRLWGSTTTAQWYAALALANFTTVVDFGLRTAGHAELHKHVRSELSVSEAGEHFRQVWSWIRLLMIITTALLVAGQAGYTIFFQHASYPLWKIAIILAYSLETILVIRIVYLDTLGFYRGAEASYFLFAALRLVLSVPAILFFHFDVNGLAWLFLISAAVATGIQGFLLCRNLNSLKLLSAPPKKLSLKVLLLSRLTVAEPFANWVRLNLPVVVISAIAPAVAVTTFVGLRAAFGAARTTIQQLSRVASVECLRLRVAGETKQGNKLLLVFILLASLVATAASVAVSSDNMRLVGLWLTNVDRKLFQTVSLAFVLSAPFYAYQVPLNFMFRIGELGWIARRHYLYAVCAFVFALSAWKIGNLMAYMIMLAGSEIIHSVLLMLAGKHTATALPGEVQSGLQFCAAGSLLAMLLWWAAYSNVFDFLVRSSEFAALETAGFAIMCSAILAGCEYAANPELVRMLWPFKRKAGEMSPFPLFKLNTPKLP